MISNSLCFSFIFQCRDISSSWSITTWHLRNLSIYLNISNARHSFYTSKKISVKNFFSRTLRTVWLNDWKLCSDLILKFHIVTLKILKMLQPEATNPFNLFKHFKYDVTRGGFRQIKFPWKIAFAGHYGHFIWRRRVVRLTLSCVHFKICEMCTTGSTLCAHTCEDTSSIRAV